MGNRILKLIGWVLQYREEALASRRGGLIAKKFSTGLNFQQCLLLVYTDWQLDCIDAYQYGPAFDRMKKQQDRLNKAIHYLRSIEAEEKSCNEK